jgi:hypothetical protein
MGTKDAAYAFKLLGVLKDFNPQHMGVFFGDCVAGRNEVFNRGVSEPECAQFRVCEKGGLL